MDWDNCKGVININTKEFKIHLMRGLMRPEYFYIPLLARTSTLKILIDKTDMNGILQSGATLQLLSRDNINIPSAKIKGAVKTYEYASSSVSYIRFKTTGDRVTIEDLEAGEYSLTEYEPPMFYELDGFKTGDQDFKLNADGLCVTTYGSVLIKDNLFTIRNHPRNAIYFVFSKVDNPLSKTFRCEYITDRMDWEGLISYSSDSRVMYSVGKVYEDGTDNSLFRTDWWTHYEYISTSYDSIFAVKIYDKGVYKGYFTIVNVDADEYSIYNYYKWITYRGAAWENTLELLDNTNGSEASDVDYARSTNDFYPRNMWRWEENPSPNFRNIRRLYMRRDAVPSGDYESHTDCSGESPWEKKYGEPAQLGNYVPFTDGTGKSSTASMTNTRFGYTTKAYGTSQTGSASTTLYFQGVYYEKRRTIFPSTNLAVTDDDFTPTFFPGLVNSEETSNHRWNVPMIINNVPSADTLPEYDTMDISISYDDAGEPIIEGAGECIYYGDGLTKEELSSYQRMFSNGRGDLGEQIRSDTDRFDYTY